MIDPQLIGQGEQPPRRIAVYLRWDRFSALADYLLRKYGCEVPISFSLPSAKELPESTWSIGHFPRRVVIDDGTMRRRARIWPN